VIENNVVARAQANGVTSGHYSSNPTVANNTLVGNGENGIDLADAATTNAYVVNNIVANNLNYGIQDCCGIGNYPSGTHYIDNLAYGNTRSNTPGISDTTATVSGEIIANPLFVNPSADNYQLQAASPALHSGTSQKAPSFDFNGNPRPHGAAFNRGAFSHWRLRPSHLRRQAGHRSR
jgi:serine protease